MFLAAMTSVAAAQDSLTFEPGLYNVESKTMMMGSVVNEEESQECVVEGDNVASYARFEEMTDGQIMCSFSETVFGDGTISSNVSCDVPGMSARIDGQSTVSYTSQSLDLNYEGEMSSGNMKAPVAMAIKAFKISDNCSP